MSYEGTLTQLIAPDLALGWQSGVDLTFELRPIGESSANERSWNGKNVNLASEEFRLYAVRISSGRYEYLPPALAALWPGDEFDIVPPLKLGDMIPTGGQSRTLARKPHPATVRCLTLAFDDVAFSVNDSVVTLVAPATSPVRIFYQPEMRVFVKDPWEQTFKERDVDVSWSLPCEEVGGTL